MLLTNILSFFHVDALSIIMICLVSFIGLVVYFFSRRYMKGDALYPHFLRNIGILLASVILMTVSDNLVLFLGAWCSCNGMLGRLMVHKSTWKAAKASGRIALQNFILGGVFILSAFSLMYYITGSLSIQFIIHSSTQLDSGYMSITLILLFMGAMTQSAIWPFHRWLISSLNSPTPVSALMHAGIVNAGGVLLARFAPAYLNHPKILTLIFIAGIISTLLGSLWKLMQHDVKRMLACSTMGQMGFMFVQCGLGLFAGAIAHLCWHGMFKAYLFLASGAAGQEKRLDLGYPPSLSCFLAALICAILGCYFFALSNHEAFIPKDARLIMVGIVFVAGAQLALTILRGAVLKKLPVAMSLTAIMGAIYGVNVNLFEFILSPLNLVQAQALTLFHVSALIILVFSWLFILFVRYSNYKVALPNWILAFYVKTLNSSQPHPATITACRKGYDYV